MNTEQIIKALECCSNWKRPKDCRECPYYHPTYLCDDALMKDALALIKKQQNEIEEWQERYLEKFKENFPLEIHNTLLKRENKYLRERLAEEMEHAEDMRGTHND